MTVVALDTNALMMAVELDVRVFDELDRLLGAVEPVTIRAVVDELDRLAASGTGTEATAASVGADLATDRCRIIEADTDESSTADDALVELARDGAFEYVVTNDRPLTERLLDAGVPVIGLRGRNKLTITQP